MHPPIQLFEHISKICNYSMQNQNRYKQNKEKCSVPQNMLAKLQIATDFNRG